MVNKIWPAVTPQEASITLLMESQQILQKNSGSIPVLSTTNSMKATQGHLRLVACPRTASLVAAPAGDKAGELRGAKDPLHVGQGQHLVLANSYLLVQGPLQMEIKTSVTKYGRTNFDTLLTTAPYLPVCIINQNLDCSNACWPRPCCSGRSTQSDPQTFFQIAAVIQKLKPNHAASGQGKTNRRGREYRPLK